MPRRASMFRYGSMMIRVSECTLFTEEPCVPPSCTNHSICMPPGRTLAILTYHPRTNPADFRRLLEEVKNLGLNLEVVLKPDAANPMDVMDEFQRVMG